MRGLIGRLLAIGADPADDEDTRLRKVLLVSALRTNPARLDLGGQVAEVTAMFAVLGGYTTYIDQRRGRRPIRVLNGALRSRPGHLHRRRKLR